MKFDTKELRRRARERAHNNAHAQLAIEIVCDYLDDCDAKEPPKEHALASHPKTEPPPHK